MSMQTLHQYYYSKRKAVTKAVTYTLLSVLLVAFGVYSFIHWELSFLFSEWKGYVIIIVYGLITLGIILSAVEAFRKIRLTDRGIPAFGVGDDQFVLYDNDGMVNVVPFEECEHVRFKSRYSRYTGTRVTLIIKYHDKMESPGIFEVDLSELDRPQSEIDNQLKKIYNSYKKKQESPK